MKEPNRTISRFRGGVDLPRLKFATDLGAIETMPPVGEYRVLNESPGGALVVARGDAVFAGRVIVRPPSSAEPPILSPTSGTVCDIVRSSKRGGRTTETIVITADGADRVADGLGVARDPASFTKDQILTEALRLGVRGISDVLSSGDVVPKRIIVNAIESEPYFTPGAAVIRTHAPLLVKAASLIAGRFAAPVVFAVGSDAAETADLLAVGDAHGDNVSVAVVPVRHPASDPRLVVAAVAGVSIPHPTTTAEAGYPVIDVTSLLALARALYDAIPAVERIVTVSGDGVRSPKNLSVRIGTPIGAILDHCGGVAAATRAIIVGGPMAGAAVDDPYASVTHATNGIVAMTAPSSFAAEPCIRCGRCVGVCPMGLPPYLYSIHVERGRFAKLTGLGLESCIECGSCAYVCPASRPILGSIRAAKAQLAVP